MKHLRDAIDLAGGLIDANHDLFQARERIAELEAVIRGDSRTENPVAPCGDDADLERFAPLCDLELDPGIRRYVLILLRGGVETYESCQGGDGHAFFEPSVRFSGGPAAGFHALSVAMTYGLPVAELRRFWSMQDGEPRGPQWEMTFWKKDDVAEIKNG